MSQTDSTQTAHRIKTKSHPEVYYLGHSIYDRGELEIVVAIADHINDDWRVVITMGPYRAYNLQYKILSDSHIVRLDFYSVRPHGGEYDIETVIDDIQSGIRNAEKSS